MLLLIWQLEVVKVEEWHCTRVTISRIDPPLVRHEVVLVEKLGTFRGLRDQPLCFTDVPDYDMTDISIELLSCQLKILIRLKLLFP